MAEQSKIEWCDHTFNPWEGCQKVGPGCDHCYAETRNARYGGGIAINWGPGAPRRRTSVANWRKPLQWNKQKFYQCACGWRGAESELDVQQYGFTAGLPACPVCDRLDFQPARARVFCASLADVFDNAVDPAWRMDLFSLIAETPNLDWLLLTKRIGNVMSMCSGDGLMFDMICNRVWLGATVVNQEEADRDIPKLLSVPATKRFLSMEPLLGPVTFEGMFANPADARDGTNVLEELDWIIVGGESGHNARPMHPDWARSLRDQCQAAGVPFLFKQWGEWLPGHHYTPELQERDSDLVQSRYPCAQFDGKNWDIGYRFSFEVEDDGALWRVGKKAAGRLLDGRTWDEFPVVGEIARVA